MSFHAGKLNFDIVEILHTSRKVFEQEIKIRYVAERFFNS